MKKIIFCCSLILFVSFLLTCKDFHPAGEFEDEVVYTDVVYSPDGNSLTVYLEGTVPVSKSRSRALNLQLAQLGHDYFELAFMYNHGGGNYTIARAAWETGHAAGVKGVYRTEGGVDYSTVTNNPGANTGTAVIFVGKKSDKTLLAVGKLSLINGDPVSPTVLVTTATKTVTFEVAALQGGTDFMTINGGVKTTNSTFLTAASGDDSSGGTYTTISINNTKIVDALVDRNNFPAFTFPLDSTVSTRYTIDAFDSGGNSIIGNYINGIILVGAAAPDNPKATKTIPRFPTGGGGHLSVSSEIYQLEDHTVITMTTNQGMGVFNKNIDFTFTTNALDNGKINSFYFEIPVYPLSNATSPGAASPGMWYIRPGYDSYLYDLDNGDGGTGGAVLYGIGNLTNLQYRLVITKPPRKVNYNDDPYDYLFDPSEITAFMQSGNLKIRNVSNDLRYWVGVGHENGPVEIFFTNPPGITDVEDYFDEFGSYNMLIITAEFEEGSKIYPDTFAIYRSMGSAQIGPISHDNRFVIMNESDFHNFITVMPSLPNRQFVLVFFNSYNIPTVNIPGTDAVIVVLAAREGITIGKAAAGGFLNNSGSGNTYYFGVWPFNEPFSVWGKPIEPQPYTINATGPYGQVGTGPNGTTPTTETNGFIRNNTANITVRTGPVTVINQNYFIVPNIPSWPPPP
jgi:hypothetical protein